MPRSPIFETGFPREVPLSLRYVFVCTRPNLSKIFPRGDSESGPASEAPPLWIIAVAYTHERRMRLPMLQVLTCDVPRLSLIQSRPDEALMENFLPSSSLGFWFPLPKLDIPYM